MPITTIDQDAEALTLTIVADFPVPLERLWNAYADPRQIERFWGPPQWPATFTRHDLVVGGRSEYHMTGPEGEIAGGFWEFLAVDAPHSFEVRDGFRDADGKDATQMPDMRVVFGFESTEGGSRLVTTTYFNSAEELEQLVKMGMIEGTELAMGQIDDVLADLASFAAELPVLAQLLDDTHVRVSRVIRGSAEQVWQAHHDAELLKRWQLGPDGWSMPTCEVATEAGQSYLFEWENDADGTRFGFTGEALEVEAPYRAVTTERMTGTEGPSTLNELTLTPVEGGTLLSLLITYPSKELRDQILATGMTDGMEISYARLETILA